MPAAFNSSTSCPLLQPLRCKASKRSRSGSRASTTALRFLGASRWLNAYNINWFLPVTFEDPAIDLSFQRRTERASMAKQPATISGHRPYVVPTVPSLELAIAQQEAAQPHASKGKR